MGDLDQAKNSWLRALLRPVMRFVVKQRLPIQDVVESIKELLIEAAAQQLELSGETITISRLSVITGMHRRDVSRMRKKVVSAEPSLSLTGRVIGQWVEDKRFLDKLGKPQLLSYKGERAGFKKLVGLVSTDVKPATVLSELLDIGAIEKVGDKVKIVSNVYQVSDNADAGFALLARDTQDLIEGVEENILANPVVPNLHARTEFDNIYQEDLPQIREWLLQEGSIFHKKVRNFLSGFDRDINPDEKKRGGGKVVIGTFSRADCATA